MLARVLIEALAAVGTGDVLMVAKRDRIGRDPLVVIMIEAAVKRQGGRVVSVAGEGTQDDDPASILLRRIVDAFAEYERLLIKARTRSALAAKRRRGQRVGSVPIGYDLADDGQRSKQGQPVALVVNPAEVAVIALVHQLRAEGRSLRAIAAELDRRGIPPKQGAARWSHSAVVKILARPLEAQPFYYILGVGTGIECRGNRRLDPPLKESPSWPHRSRKPAPRRPAR